MNQGDLQELETLSNIEASGNLNPVQRTRLQQLRATYPNVGNVSGGVPMFSFDYAGEAQKAYGEFGAYYDRILRESQGDMNKVLARLTEDYNRGVRIKKEDTETQRQNLERSVRDNALARGLYQKSPYDQALNAPFGGMGIPQSTYERANAPLQQGLNRYVEGATIEKQRQEVDIPEAQKRKEFDLEQQRRREAADLANNRAQQAYSKFQSSLF